MRKLLLLVFLVGSVLPLRAAKQVTVVQLEQTLAEAHGKKDQDLAKQLGGLELSERLSSTRLEKIKGGLPGEKSRLALLALADASAFLQLPAAEIPANAPPDADTQKLILSKAADEVKASLHRFPDFFARKTITRFHDLKISYPTTEPVILEHQAFQFLDSSSDTVYYRDGKEVEEAGEKQPGIDPLSSIGQVNWGVFGPLLQAVKDIYEGKIEWSHWEQLATGPVAVFQYAIPKEGSHYAVKYCCLGLPNTGLRSFESIPAFHGEVAIDPATGAVNRLVIITELSPSDPIFQARVMVEYEPVEIGGEIYICPHKSVTITTAIVPMQHQGCRARDGVSAVDCNQLETFKPRDTAINDTEYDSYHVFRSEVRISPAESQ